MAKMGRPKKEIKLEQLKSLMRLKPSQEDAAAFFEVSVDQIARVIRKNWNCTFSEFREQNMVHTRFNLIRTALQRSERSDTMLIFCLKNLCGWKDKEDLVTQGNSQITLNYNLKDE